MAQDYSIKHRNFLNRLSPVVVDLMTAADELTVLCAEHAANGYADGGANPLTDAVVQSVLPAATAALVWYAVGELANSGAILPAIAANRVALEAMRP